MAGDSQLQWETPEQRKGRDRTMGIKETSEAGAEGGVGGRRGEENTLKRWQSPAHVD